MNEAFTEVLNAAELPVGRIRAVKVDDRTVAISHTARGFFATDNTCPHRGGTLHNKVVFRAARGLEAANVATLRFNFRGTGASAGHHEEGEGEQGDVVAAINWLMKKHPGRKVIAGGFSFGAWVASRAACEI